MPIRQVHHCGKTDSAVPPLPRATKQLSGSHQLSSPLSLLSSITEALGAVGGEGMDPDEGVQSHRDPGPHHQRLCPFASDVLVSHGQSSTRSADRCSFPSGLPDLQSQILYRHLCPGSYPLAVPSLQLHFQRGSHMFGLCWDRVVQLPIPAPKTPLFLLVSP